MTEMACPGGRMEQDTWVADFLSAGPRMSLDGDQLTLTGSTITMVLTDRRVVDPDRPLAGTRWVVDTIFQGDTASSGALGGTGRARHRRIRRIRGDHGLCRRRADRAPRASLPVA